MRKNSLALIGFYCARGKARMPTKGMLVMDFLRFTGIVFTLCVSLILPVFAAAFICKRFRLRLLYVLLGALGFIVMQMLIRIPLLGSAYTQFYLSAMPPIVSIFLLAFTAGLFETGGRYLVFRLFFKNERRLVGALGAGIGHGGIEAIALVGINYCNFIIIGALLLFAPQSALLPALGITDAVAAQFCAISPLGFFAAGVERVCAMTLHVFLSVLLFYFMQKKQSLRGFALVTLIHTVFDFTAQLPRLFVKNADAQLLLAELIVLIGAVICGFFLFRLAKRWPRDAAPLCTKEDIVN